ncbi:hypothetical protein HV819_06580 [Anaerococcus sp. AGMB00486]|uniref:Uncharacterized protein n=1 Tax=Anaerococcus faecalis TaxID=2742993 RepID=A0ABX2NAD2_9FIRM|nr:hypothetical protein [Anaerococcus faecalis]MDD7305407.1 hypothetical protein [Peptoniphilaceae bacterium]MDY3923234.1 hypothetical protein [Ezakiella sp.]NVF11646.1 hypothetical protein [Anaerococcus faecalis]
MKEIILAILMGLWSYYWYKLGYVQAQINETQKRIREIYRDIEKQLDETQRTVDKCIQSLDEIKYK